MSRVCCSLFSVALLGLLLGVGVVDVPTAQAQSSSSEGGGGDFDDFSAEDDAGWLSDVLWNAVVNVKRWFVELLDAIICALGQLFFGFLFWLLQPVEIALNGLASVVVAVIGTVDESGLGSAGTVGTARYWLEVANVWFPISEILSQVVAMALLLATVIPVRAAVKYLVPGLG